ncbi:TPA: hypothetical protein QIC23_001856 [Klebsiella aerogenes]|nr:hypothetical protein [Klebsiella aerogenes]
MGWPEAVVEALHILKTMPKWMSGMVLVVAILLSAGYLIEKLSTWLNSQQQEND